MGILAFNLCIVAAVIHFLPCAGLYRCAEGWTLHGHYCYHFKLTWSSRVTWHQARHLCETMGAQMITVSSQEEQDYIQERVKSFNSSLEKMWIGLHDNGHNNFVWTNNSNGMTFTNWAEYEPSTKAENCVITWRNNTWNDVNCDSRYPYICKTTITHNTGGTCPSAWHRYHDNCYFIPYNTTELVTWKEAQNRCHQQQSDLVKIEYLEENNFIFTLLPVNLSQNYWIGLNDNRSEGRWRWNNDQSSGQWYNWYPTQPDNGRKGPNDCASILLRSTTWKGKWKPKYCGASFRFLCEALAIVQDREVKCKESWVRNGDHCYFMGMNYTTWELARTTCQYKGGDLAQITSDVETKFLSDNFYSKEVVWIGLHNNNGSNKWYWLNETKTPIAYQNWLPWEPWESQQFTCVMMHATRHNLGKWDNVQCNIKFPFICQGFDRSVDCKSPWKAFAGECYLVRLSAVNWYQAKQICKRIRVDSNLAEIKSPAVQYFLNGLISEKEGYGGYWFGLNSLKQWQTYQWINRTKPVTFTNWDIRQPDHIRDDGCVAMYTSFTRRKEGQWDDSYCFDRAGLGCQSNAVNTFFDFNLEGVIYKFIGMQLAYPEAREYCKLSLGDGADLITIESIELWHAVISNARLHRTTGKKQFWVGSVNKTVLPVDDSAVRKSEESGALHEIKDWCTYIMENTSKTQWTEEYSLVRGSCYTKKYSICQKPSRILEKIHFSFVFRNVTYIIIRDMTLIRADLNRTCRFMMGNAGHVASLENDDQVMALFTEIRAVPNSQTDNIGYWIDTNPEPGTLLKKRLRSLPRSNQCPLMRLDKLSSDWSIHTAIQSVQTADSCLEYHQIICQRNQLNQEIDGEEIPFVTVTEPTEQPRADEIKITPNETIKYSCTGTCVGLAVILAIVIIICLCLLAALVYMKRKWICGFCETAPDEVRLRDQAEPTAFTDPPPQPEEAATST